MLAARSWRQQAGAAPPAAAPLQPRRRHQARHLRQQRKVQAAATTALAPSTVAQTAKLSRKVERAQQTVMGAIADVQGRGKGGMTPEQQAAFDAAVAVLEADGGVAAPTDSPLLDGRWRLLFTTRPGTASPIQRTFTAVESFKIYQDIDLTVEQPRVCQVVDFGKSVGYLRVEAEASTDSRPLAGFTPRRGEGLPFGIMGRSSSEPPARRGLRVDFQFDRAAFTFNALPFKVPYPVPFRMLGDEAKGWIDVTYLSPDGKLRLTRGNKGTLFVLSKEVSAKARLLEALASRQRDDDLIEQLAAEVQAEGGGEAVPASSPVAVGKWRLVWTRQGATANPLQKALAGQVDNWQIISPDGRLENRVQLLPGLRVRALAEAGPEPAPGGGMRTGVAIEEVVIEAGPLRLPLPVKTDTRGFVEWDYLDSDFRISRGSKGSTFIHVREA